MDDLLTSYISLMLTNLNKQRKESTAAGPAGKGKPAAGAKAPAGAKAAAAPSKAAPSNIRSAGKPSSRNAGRPGARR